MKVEIKIAASNEELERILDLRYEVLRAPWKKDRSSATDEMEATSVNVYAENQQGKVIACGRLQENTNKIGQIRFMAVDPEWQGKKLGNKIIKALEAEAKKIGLKSIELQARENALGFYEANAYTVIEKSFILWDQIQHYLMSKEM